MENIKAISDEAASVISALQHPNGTYEYYIHTLGGLYAYVLHQSDEIGMDDTEAIHSLRVLEALRNDLKTLKDGIKLTDDSLHYKTISEAVTETFNGFNVETQSKEVVE